MTISLDLIDDSEMLAQLNADACASGELLVCGRCGSQNEIIVGVMVFRPTNLAVLLCGPCWGRLPPTAYEI